MSILRNARILKNASKHTSSHDEDWALKQEWNYRPALSIPYLKEKVVNIKRSVSAAGICTNYYRE